MQRKRVWKATAGGMLMGGVLSCAHAQAGPCKDPWINQAFHQMYNRSPVGSGTTGECDITRYGNGHWSSYQDLMSKISQHNAAVRSVPSSSAAAQTGPVMRPSPTPQPVATVAPPSASATNRSVGRIISQDGSSLISDAGANAKPGSSIISQDSGGLVSNASGTMRSLQSVDKPRAPTGKYLVIPGGNLVDANGNTVRWAGAYTIVVKNGVSMIGVNGKTPVPGTVVTP